MEWTEVNDRLPQIEFPLILYSKKYGVQKGFRLTDRRNKHCFQVYASGLKVLDVTHWMPLPEPPKP